MLAYARVAGFVAGLLQALQARRGRLGRHVAAVEEGVHVDLRHAFAAGQFDHREDVPLVSVLPAGREQAEQMQGGAGGLGRGAGGAQFIVGGIL